MNEDLLAFVLFFGLLFGLPVLVVVNDYFSYVWANVVCKIFGWDKYNANDD